MNEQEISHTRTSYLEVLAVERMNLITHFLNQFISEKSPRRIKTMFLKTMVHKLETI